MRRKGGVGGESTSREGKKGQQEGALTGEIGQAKEQEMGDMVGCVCGEEPSRGTLYRVTRRLAPISSWGDEAVRPGSDRPLGQGASIGAMKRG
jgi:hypothetical protein